MSDVANERIEPVSTEERRKQRAGRVVRSRRYLFWAAAAIAFGAAAVAAIAPQAAGPSGLILLSGIAAAGLLLLYALAAGEAAKRWLTPSSEHDDDERDRDRTAAAAAFEVLTEPAVIVDRIGLPRRANAAYRQLAENAGVHSITGRPPSIERILGGHPGLSQAVFRLTRAAMRGAARRERLPVLVDADGRTRAYELETAPLPGGESLWRAREIGGSSAEGDAIESAGADALVEDAPIGFFSAAPDGRVLYMNETLRSWLGAPIHIEGLKLKDFIADDASRVLGRGRRPGGGPVRADVTLKCRDGIVSQATVVTTWPAGPGGKPASRSVVFDRAGLGAPVGVAQALTPAGAAEPAATMDAMFANAPFGVARLDGVDVGVALIVDANPALLDLTNGHGAPGTRFADLFVVEDGEARAKFEAAETGFDAALELQIAGDEDQKRGEERYARVFFIRERGGRKTAYLLEITEERAYRHQFLQSQKMDALGKLSAEIAHNMNNILLAIKLNTGLLLERHPIGDPAYPLLSEISGSVAAGAGLARSLLAFSRQQTFKPEVLDVTEAVSDFFITVRSLVGSAVHARLEHGRDLPLIKVDRGQLMQAIINLANNARDAMAPRGGDLVIRTDIADAEAVREAGAPDAPDGEYAVIEVSDTGSGMDEETLARIFEPFFTTKELGKGTGLGLSTVFGIVAQSGGHVDVTSVLGEGTTFRLFLPSYDATPEEREAALSRRRKETRQPVDLSGVGRILLVEDDDTARRASIMVLKRRGYEVIETCDGEEALEVLEDRADEIDLVLSDVSMPGMNGPELLKHARPLIGAKPFVLMSGLAREDLADTLAADENVSFLSKPFDIQDLSALMKSEISASAAASAAREGADEDA